MGKLPVDAHSPATSRGRMPDLQERSHFLFLAYCHAVQKSLRDTDATNVLVCPRMMATLTGCNATLEGPLTLFIDLILVEPLFMSYFRMTTFSRGVFVSVVVSFCESLEISLCFSFTVFVLDFYLLCGLWWEVSARVRKDGSSAV